MVVIHFWAHDGKRKQLLGALADYADRVKASEKAPAITVQSFGVLKELRDLKLASLYIRSVKMFLHVPVFVHWSQIMSFLGRARGATGTTSSLRRPSKNYSMTSSP